MPFWFSTGNFNLQVQTDFNLQMNCLDTAKICPRFFNPYTCAQGLFLEGLNPYFIIQIGNIFS